jgi:tetratricopeptide (TPR) repeat protein
MKVTAERARWAQVRAANPNAEDLAWRCSAAVMRDAGYFSDPSYSTCEQALQIDSGNVRALSLLSFKFSQRVATFASADRQADLRRADELASSAIKIDPDYSLAQTAKGDVLQLAGRYREAIDTYQRALMLAPSNFHAYIGIALAYARLGEPEQAIASADKAMRLNPHDPFSAALCFAKAIAFGVLQDYEEALVWVQRAEAAATDNPIKGLVPAGLLALVGRESDARAMMQHYLSNENAPFRTIAQWQHAQVRADNPRLLAWRQKFMEGLRKAGLPE